MAGCLLARSQGNELMKGEKFDEALNCYTKAIELDARNAVFYCNRCVSLSFSLPLLEPRFPVCLSLLLTGDEIHLSPPVLASPCTLSVRDSERERERERSVWRQGFPLTRLLSRLISSVSFCLPPSLFRFASRVTCMLSLSLSLPLSRS